MKKLATTILCLALSLFALPKNFEAPSNKNIALGKECTFLIPPNYQLCTDEGDSKQLTDGKFDKTNMWWNKETCVGWRNSDPANPKIIKERPVGFTIDLGEVEPIQGFMYSTVAGDVGITFPYYICIYTSVDGKEWHFTGDLVKQSAKEYGAPPEDIFLHHKFASLKMPTKGRYVAFVMKANQYVFIDEIAIYKGDKPLLDVPPAGPVVTDLLQHNNKSYSMYQQRLINDVNFLEQARYPELNAMLDDISTEIESIKSFDKKMLTILPLSDLQRKIFALNSVRLKKNGFTSPAIWRNNRWDNLAPMTIPPKGNPAPLAVEMIRGEIRGETFNIVNPTDAPQKFDISVLGLPREAAIDCREVLYTDTNQSKCTSSALKPGNGDKITIEIPAGISTQIWISFKKPSCKAGTYNGKVIAKGVNTLEIPISLTIHDFDFPARPRLHVGGWDYTEGNGGFFGMPQRLEDNLKFMRDMYVDSPWAHAKVAPQGEKFDAAGHLVNKNELDYTEWNRWTKRWHDARLYCIFMHVAGINNDKDASWHGEKPGTERFKTMVNDYYKAWAEYMTAHGVKPSQVVLLLIDEPWEESGRDSKLVPWARAIKAAVPDIKIFNDPIFRDISKCDKELFEVSDIICPNLPHMVARNQIEFFENLRKNGTTLFLYSCHGPSRLLDPVTYYRVQHWRLFMMGGEGSFYWAMGSAGSPIGSWNAYSQGTDFSPYFASGKGPFMESKQYEGIREGVQDYEYLCMLRDRIAELKKAGKDVAAAEKFLAAAPERAIVEIKPADATWARQFNINWTDEKDRSVMDKVRVEVLRMLTKLK